MIIAHFSDLHLCPQAGGPAQLAAVVESVRAAKRLGADHFVFTGDIVDHGNLKSLSALMRELDALSLASPKRTTIVPGNHDIFPVSAFRVSFAGNAQANFESFQRRVRRCLPRDERVWSEQTWPFIRRLSRDVVLVALDTTHSGWLGRLCGGVGELDGDDATEVLEQLEADHSGCRWRVLAMHHWPFGWSCGQVPSFLPSVFGDVNFRDLPAVRRFIRQGRFDVVLCGHQHGFGVRDLGQSAVVRSAWHWSAVDDGIAFDGGFHLVQLGRRMRMSEHTHEGVLAV